MGTGAVALLAGGAALGLSTGWGAPSPGASCPQVQALPSYPTRPSSLVHSICTPWVLASASGAPDAQVAALRKKLKDIFKRYASVEKDGEQFMTIQDFMSSILPADETPDAEGNEASTPEYLGDSQIEVLFSVVDKDKSGLISFGDYQVLFEMLTTPQSEFAVAFKLFDKNNDGFVTQEDFRKIMETESRAMKDFDFDCDMMHRFFGPEGSGKLSYAQFSQFCKALQEEIIKQEFKRYDRDNDGYISGDDFGKILYSYMDQNRLPRRIKHKFQNMETKLRAGRISYAEFDAFNKMLRELDAVAKGIKAAAAKMEGGIITKNDFVASVYSSTGVSMSPLEVDIIFQVFDDDDDGKLTPAEYEDFLQLVSERKQRAYTVNQWLTTANEIPVKNADEKMTASQRTLANLLEGIKSFAIGGVAGAIGATVVYPIDLVKTRMQNQRKLRAALPAGEAPKILYKNGLDCFSKVVKAEGFVGLYRGLVPQLIGVAPEKAIKLVVNDFLRTFFTNQAKKKGSKTAPGEISLIQEIISGGCAGGAQVIFTNPLEIVKIRLQMQGQLAAEGKASKGAVTIVKELGFRGLYKGAGACLMRDVPFSAIYFPTYAWARAKFSGGKGHSPQPHHLLLAGSFAGVFAASLSTPADVIKTRLQTESRSAKPEYTGIIQCARKIMVEEGFGAFWKGAIQRVIRSSPQFGVTLLAYEMIQRLFATDPSRPRPLSVMAAGAAISEEDHVVMQEIIHQNLKRLKRIGLLKREDMDKYYETKEKSKQKTLRKPPAEPFPRRMADHIPNDEQLRNMDVTEEFLALDSQDEDVLDVHPRALRSRTRDVVLAQDKKSHLVSDVSAPGQVDASDKEEQDEAETAGVPSSPVEPAEDTPQK